jgi:nitrogen fixation NifU-like protein
MSDQYHERILDHYEDPFHRELLQRPTHLAEGANPVCGDSVRIELRIESDSSISETGFDAEGCVLCQAAASMLLEHIDGFTAEQVRDVSARDMLQILGSPLATDRQRCCLLPWRILQTALQSPVSSEGDEDDDPSFGGPSLSEEC